MEPSPTPQWRPDVSQAPQAVPLSAGLPTVNRVVMVVLAAVSVFVLLPLLGLVSVGLAASGAMGPLGPLLMVIVGLVVLGFVAFGLVRVFRAGARLEGTVLRVRGALRTRRVDLATAQLLRLTNANSGWTAKPLIPSLDAYSDAQGRSVTVHFGRARQGFLPLAEVEALAFAIRTGRREGLAAQHAEHTVRELYLRAYDPTWSRPF